MERILCAAIWYKELPTQTFLPKNIDKGLVVLGYRHYHCIDIMKTLGQLRTARFGPDSIGENVQGFLTNLNRFVDRGEAREIALAAGQIEDLKTYSGVALFSEDLY